MTTHAPPQSRPLARSGADHAGVPGVGVDRDAPLRADDGSGGALPRGFAARLPWIKLGVVGFAALLVFWAFEALPFQDLPAHAGLIAMRHRFATSPFEQRFFVFAPHVGPYSLFRFLGEAFVELLGPVGAVRALATLPPLATPLVLLFARKRLHGDRTPTVAYFGVALSFGLMTLLGFASYLLGVAVMLFALTLWLELMVAADDPRQSTGRRELLMTVVAPLVFVAHGHAFVLFLAMAGVSALATGDRFRRALRFRALLPALALAAYVAWLEKGASIPEGSAPVPHSGLAPRFQGASDKLSLLITPTLITRTGIDLIIGVAIWILAVAAVVATVRHRDGGRASANALHDDERSRKHSVALVACAIALAIAFLALPHTIGWFGFVDGRLVPLLLMLALLAYRRQALSPTLRTLLDRGAPVLATGMVALALVASARFQEEARGYREVLAKVPAEVRLLNLPLDPDSAIFTAHPFVHYDKLVLAERPIVVSDVWFHQGSALYPTDANPALRLPSSYSESDLRGIDWPAYRLEDWDYVLIRTRPNASAPAIPPELVLADHRGGWWLYRTVTSASARTL